MAVKILLLSDLHAYAGDGALAGPSYINASKHPRTPADDAFEALKSLVTKERLSPDFVICAGDLGDRASPQGVAHAWTELNAVGSLCKARLTTAVCGNHDLDSRFLANDGDPDPKGRLQELSPRFPISDERLFDRFWSRNFVTFDDEQSGTRLLLLNSSAFHGGKEGEIDHGRVSSRTLSAIKHTLDAEGPRSINILVCHHHPFPHARLDHQADYEAISNGQALIDLLAAAAYGPWIVLHGHRHHPRILYAAGSSGPPLVIGAATFSARTSEVANQVHLLDVEASDDPNYELRGIVKSWTFSLGNGFVQTPRSTNALPGSCGFGYRGNIRTLARRLSRKIGTSGKAYLSWDEIEVAEEHVRFLTPEQFDHCVSELKHLGFRVLFDTNGVPIQLVPA